MGRADNFAKKWREEDLRALRKLGHLHHAEAGALMGRSAASVEKKRRSLGLTWPAKHAGGMPWTDEEESFVLAHWGTMSIDELVQELGRSKGAIRTRVSEITADRGGSWQDNYKPPRQLIKDADMAAAYRLSGITYA